jgi:RNA polymerase sigma factor (sigma-70 family)
MRSRPDPSGLAPFDGVVEAYGRDVWRFCVSQVGRDRADDLFQETMLAALAAYPEMRDATRVRSWLLRIAARKAVDQFRRRARAPEPVAEPDAGAALENGRMPDEELWARVRALPPKQRQALGLRFVLDLGYDDIGEAMTTSAEAARRNVFEALRTLRQEVGHR